jgi:pilus assembly protein CpaC
MSCNKTSVTNASARKALLALALAAFAGLSPALAQRAASESRISLGGDGAASRSIVLPLDKAAIVELPTAAADVLVSQPAVVDAVIRSSQRVYLLGLKVGQTNAFFFDANGRQILNLEIQVERDVDALSSLISRLMPDTRITVEAINDTVVLRGTVATGVQATNAHDIAARFVDNEEKVINMLSIRDREQVMLKVRVVEMQRSLIKQLGIDPSGFTSISDTVFDATASTLASGASAGLTGTVSRFFGGGQSGFNINFQALERVGLVKTLAEPTLTAVSGETASFLAGGEFPIPIGQNDGVISLEFKEFGVGLGFTPLVLGKGRINIKVQTEVSEISSLNNFSLSGSTATFPGTPPPPDELIPIDTDGDGNPDSVFNVTEAAGEVLQGTDPTIITQTGLTVPSLTVRRAKTTVELPSGGSLVMAGLLQQNMRQTISGVPYLKDVAVLGQLFRSRDYQNAETELVIIVTPYLVDPTHESKLTDPAKGFVSASDMQTILLGDIVAQYGVNGAGVQEKTLQGPLGFILD